MIAIICTICGDKQSGFIKDFPLSEELNHNGICAKCSDKKLDLFKYASMANDIYKGKCEYFSNIITEGNLLSETKKSIEELIEITGQRNREFNEKEKENFSLVEQAKEKEAMLKNQVDNFLMTTGYDFEGYEVLEYKRVITSEAVLGTGFLSESTASFSDFFGVESQRFSSKLEEARNIATYKLVVKAMGSEANAIIGIDFDYIMFNKNMIGVIVNGTAVKVESKKDK